jgi:two-component system cell cycle response regulator DivK
MKQATAVVIDDNFDNCEIFRAILHGKGYDVSIYQDGQAALDALRQQTFTLAVIDLQIPDVSGLVIMESIRQNPIHKDMTIVVATANPHMVTEDVSGQADFIIYKPIEVADFGQLAARLKPVS